jgi:putative toxin-antitoxin system antitoxin component (TIGR02293 family)
VNKEFMMVAADVASLLGGRPGAGGMIESDFDLLQAVLDGLPVSAVDAIIQSGAVTADEASRLILAADEMEERRAGIQKLSQDESDRLIRVARVIASATDTFGDAEKAARWLRVPNRGLGGLVPMELLASETGAALVHETLHKIEHGIFA